MYATQLQLLTPSLPMADIYSIIINQTLKNNNISLIAKTPCTHSVCIPLRQWGTSSAVDDVIISWRGVFPSKMAEACCCTLNIISDSLALPWPFESRFFCVCSVQRRAQDALRSKHARARACTIAQKQQICIKSRESSTYYFLCSTQCFIIELPWYPS